MSPDLQFIDRLLKIVAIFLCGGAALLLLSILLANVLRLFRGRPDLGIGSVGVGAGAFALYAHWFFREDGFFSEDAVTKARLILAFGVVSIVVGLMNMIRARAPSAS
jgi:hypothetical protein